MSRNKSSKIFSGGRYVEQVELRSRFQQVENGRPSMACEARALKQSFWTGIS
jgi:hypothetical protein